MVANRDYDALELTNTELQLKEKRSAADNESFNTGMLWNQPLV
jgi:hypothetical protein